MPKKFRTPIEFPDLRQQGEQGMTYKNFINNGFWAWDFAFSGASGISSLWNSAAISTGTITTTPPTTVFDNGQIGIQCWRSSSTANSGWGFRTGGAEILLKGGEVTRCVLAPRTTSTQNTIRFGFTDSGTSASPTDGAVFEITSSNSLSAATYNNGTSTPAGSSLTLTDATFYVLVITVNSNATSVNFSVYALTGGSALYSVDITTNIPTATGRLTGHGIVATNAGSSANDCCYIDYIDLWLPNRQRGLAA